MLVINMSAPSFTVDCEAVTEQSCLAFTSTSGDEECPVSTNSTITQLADDNSNPFVNELGQYIVIG